MTAELSIIVPVYNEGENIRRLFDEIEANVGAAANEVALVYDFEEDNTLPVARQAAGRYSFPIRLVRNAWGRGALNAIRTGFREARGPLVLVCMADLSDDLAAVSPMLARMREGCDVVCGSRYMRGGRQKGGPLLKRILSRLAGVSLHFLAGVPTHDVTNSFKMYRKQLLDRLTIESSGGFEVGMEIVVKTFAARGKIAEVPTTWTDRSAGTSRFRLWKWLPKYLHWYWFALRSRLRFAYRPAARVAGRLAPRRKLGEHTVAKVLSLGGCGFIGSYLTRKFLAEGHAVTCVDDFSKYGYVEHDFYQHANFRLVRKDTRQLEPRDYEGFDTVMCLAALIGGIQYFHRIPYRIARDNTQILTHAIDCTLAAAPQATFYYFSSSMVYERVQRPVTEEDALTQVVPLTNYGMQKLFGEYVTRGAAQEFGLNYVIVRPFNAVGSGELPHVEGSGEIAFGMAHVIPDFVYKAMLGQTPFEILGDGQQVRTFTHARDVADAVALMLRKGVRNDDFNICGNATFSVADLAKMIWGRVNAKAKWPGFKHLAAPSDDVRFRVGRSEKAARVLGWTPQCNIDVILDDTIQYLREKMGPLTHPTGGPSKSSGP